MVEPVVELLDAGILGEPQPRAAPDPDDAPGAGNHEEAQCSHAPEQERVRPFARAALRLGAGVELKAADEVVRQHAELLPGAVGGVVVRGHHVERELALQLGDGLFLGAAPTHEGEQRGQAEGHIGGDGVVLEVAVIRGEEIELEVLPRGVTDVLAIDHHADVDAPLGNGQAMVEAGHAGRQRESSRAARRPVA